MTSHILDLPPLSTITEEHHTQERTTAAASTQAPSSRDQNPFVFPTNGFVRDDGEGSPPISMVAPPTSAAADIVVTDVEDEDMEGSKIHTKVCVTILCLFLCLFHLQTQNDRVVTVSRACRQASLRVPPLSSRYKRHSISSLGHPSISPISRQASWNGYKGQGWGVEFDRVPSCLESRTIFEGSLDEVAKLLHRMAEVIERDTGSN